MGRVANLKVSLLEIDIELADEEELFLRPGECLLVSKLKWTSPNFIAKKVNCYLRGLTHRSSHISTTFRQY